MSRLIDADKLHKPIYAEEDNITGAYMNLDEMYGYNEAIDNMWEMIKNAPTVDAVEVVRCGNCANRYTKYCPLSFYGIAMPYDWFCAEGRPKEVSE